LTNEVQFEIKYFKDPEPLGISTTRGKILTSQVLPLSLMEVENIADYFF
jgi:hypothetical protein